MHKQIAIIAPTASGKTKLSIEVALETNSVILSLDSLSVYKEIDIASAKPTKDEMNGVLHFGIDEVSIDEEFGVTQFIKLYEKTVKYIKQNDKNLIIVGGSGFYLKILLNGLSLLPKITQNTQEKVFDMMNDLQFAYDFISQKDPKYMEKIASTDKYRIEKALMIYVQTNTIPSLYFEQNKPKKYIDKLEIFQIDTPKEIVSKNIEIRTKKMFEDGLISEVSFLQNKYDRNHKAFNSIGLKQGLDLLDKKMSEDEAMEKITIATRQLAKRQRTFYKSQFTNITKDDVVELKSKIIQYLNQ